jgi:hypothetical protein
MGTGSLPFGNHVRTMYWTGCAKSGLWAMAKDELRRVSHLTQQSLSFYRESAFPTPVNVEETIDSVLVIYEKRIEAKGIFLTRRYRPDGATSRTYPGELRRYLRHCSTILRKLRGRYFGTFSSVATNQGMSFV